MSMKAKRGLGRGLDSLIPKNELKKEEAPVVIGNTVTKTENNTETTANIHQVEEAADSKKIVKITSVEPNREQPRKNFEEDALEELAESIKQVGVIQPILVKTKQDYYEIIAGERRWRAAKLAGLKEVPIITRDDLTTEQIVEIQLIENIQREDLNPIEEAMGYQKLINEFGLKQDEVAEKVSKSRVAITNTMRLLKLCKEVQQMIVDGKISSGHARTLIAIEDEKLQLEMAERIFDEKLSVRQAEKLVKSLSKVKKEPVVEEVDPNLEAIYHDLEERCKQKVGTKVSIVSKGNKGAGKIEIEFYNNDDLEKITRMLMI